MGRCGIKVEIVLLDILAVITLITAQAEQSLFENRVVAIPECDGEADGLVAVADARDTVLSPAVGSRPGMIMREILPRGPVGAIVLAHGAPLTLAHVGSPLSPVALTLSGFFQSVSLGVHSVAPA